MTASSALPPEHIARLEQSLRRHLVQLRKALADAERDAVDLHLPIAGQLRALLCDRDVPILLMYAAHKGVDLRIWGPNPPGFQGPPGKLAFQFNALVASPEPTYGAFEMSIDQYLGTAVGAVPIPDPAGGRPRQTVWYTPRQLIKWVANKEGVSHLDLNPPPFLRAIQDAVSTTGTVELVGPGQDLSFGATDNFLIRSALLQIATWTIHAIERVLVTPAPAPSAAPPADK